MYQRKTFGTIHNLIRKDETIQLQGHGIRPGQGSELPPPPSHNNLIDGKKIFFCISQYLYVEAKQECQVPSKGSQVLFKIGHDICKLLSLISV